MYSSLVFLIFTTVFALVQSSDVSSVGDSYFNEVVKVGCTREFQKQVRYAVRNASCKPYLTRVNLYPPQEQKFNPPTVLVGRCGGQNDPDTGIVCMPKTTKMKQIPVAVLTLDDNGQYTKNSKECNAVNVEEHITCTPECGLRATDCNARQKFNQHKCKCECKDREARKQKCSEEQEFHDKDCECTCQRQNRNCTTGFAWNKDFCKCNKMGW